ncbi:MAG: hypothetical protein ACRD4Q_11480, partial [Candidatus Acidiferrales bacterium]
ELTEAVQESNELAAEAKAAVLENLEFVVSQVAAEPATRQKTSVIQTVWNGLAPVLAVAANLAQIYSVVGPLLIKHLAA